ncbi:MAG: MerR family transcriptional regulator [Myxococcales bacterium]|nr:MAG: MerR family transcriptional regulator [Myxococcales bacterium]
MSQILSRTELKKLEDKYTDGLSSQEIVKIFQGRGVKFSEATFRKYVQMGLVERCRRVGQKGKHRGSRGLYPVSTLERINQIKKLISGDLTLEQLKGSYFAMRQKVEEADRILIQVIDDINEYEKIKERKDRHDVQLRRDLETVVRNIRRIAKSMEDLEHAPML